MIMIMVKRNWPYVRSVDITMWIHSSYIDVKWLLIRDVYTSFMRIWSAYFSLIRNSCKHTLLYTSFYLSIKSFLFYQHSKLYIKTKKKRCCCGVNSIYYTPCATSISTYVVLGAHKGGYKPEALLLCEWRGTPPLYVLR